MLFRCGVRRGIRCGSVRCVSIESLECTCCYSASPVELAVCLCSFGLLVDATLDVWATDNVLKSNFLFNKSF